MSSNPSPVPLCPEVPVLCVVELARRESRRQRRRPEPVSWTGENDEGAPPSEPADAALERARRHLEEENCPFCRTWFENALRVHRARRSKHPGRIPQPLPSSGGKPNPRRLEFRLPAAPTGRGLDGLPAVLVWRREGEGKGPWTWVLEWRSRESDPREGVTVDSLARFHGAQVRVTFRIRGADRPVSFRAPLVPDVQGSLTTEPQRLEVDHPDRVDRVLIRRCRPEG
jgi:hypothetical protein